MPDFESGAFDHSATSPWTVQHGCAGQASHFTSDPAFLEERAAISALNLNRPGFRGGPNS